MECFKTKCEILLQYLTKIFGLARVNEKKNEHCRKVSDNYYNVTSEKGKKFLYVSDALDLRAIVLVQSFFV